ncbi:MAG: nuclear transport factor 2 family protein [Edaphobacter sp.]|uniref:nuclear transport factor 2 family protein n=1 Tax=Edaphobacter sp. TaxID=1934404 RepID=UPI00239FE810|nr:nuclear transport factor 2 family protein [Edaphobacter sp.]MDE1178616.1 nuclear transport factor 2 family protein [Edaphobacter sp.]
MSTGNVELVKSVYTAMKAGNILSLFTKLSPDIRVWQTDELPWGGTYVGLMQAKTFFGKVSAHLTPEVTLERFIDSGDYVIGIGRTQGTTKDTGKPFDVPLLHLWEVRGGKVIGLQVFLENAPMLAALTAG